MKTLFRLFTALLFVAAATGCSTYSKATTGWRRADPIWEPDILDPQSGVTAVVSLPDTHYAGRHWTDLH